MIKKIQYSLLFSFIMVLCLNIESTQAQSWEPTNGPFGGAIACFAENSTHLFGGTIGGVFGKGIYRSSDRGANWTTCNNGLSSSGQGKHVQAITVSGSYVVASTGEGIYRSADNGDNWTLCGTIGAFPCNCFITVGSVLYAGGYAGLYASTDNGLTWTAQNNGFQGISAPAVPDIQSFVNNGTYLYAGTFSRGIFRSADNGLTWTTVNNGLGTVPQINSATFGNLCASGNDVFAGTTQKGVYRLINNGTAWTREITGLPSSGNISARSLLVRDTYVYMGTNYGIYRSENSGTINWVLQNITPTGLKCNNFFQSGSDIFSSTDKGVYISSDNTVTWTPAYNGMCGLIPLSIRSAGGTDIFTSVSGGYGYYYRSSDFGDTWDIGTNTGTPFAFNNYIYISQYTGVIRSADNGATWQFLYDFGTGCSFYSMGTRLFATITCCETIFYSDDDGVSWTQCVLLGPEDFWGNVIMSITDDGTNLYAGTLNSGVLKSIDNGIHWTKLNFPTAGNIPVRVVLTNGTYLYAGTSNIYGDGTIIPVGIYRSGDEGVTWELVNNGLGSMDIGAIVFAGTDLYAGTKAGVFMSTNNGDTWTAANDGFSVIPDATSLYVSGNYIFVNNWAPAMGSPVYRRALTGNAPELPDAIVGSSTPCRLSSQTYSVTNVPGVTYAWQFPAGWVITVGGTSSSVTVTVGTSTGIVLVTPTNGWGSGPAQYLIVTQTLTTPNQPSAITGSATPLEGTIQNYSVTNVAGVSYAWTFPTGWVQTSGGTTNAVSVIVGSGSGNITVTPSTACGGGTARIKVVSPLPASKTLNLTSVLLQGLYYGSGTLNQAQGHIPPFGSGVADYITVELHDAANYANIVTVFTNVSLSTTGTATVTVASTFNGSYFITIKHRYSVETTTATAVSFAGSTINQSFGSIANIFGGNLGLTTDGHYVIYTGDVNQDGAIVSADVSMVAEAAAVFANGYGPTDLNGDGIVDSADLILVDNNSALFVVKVTP